MNAEILSIGDELLIGQIINTNQAHIAEQLNTVGISISRMTTVGDRREEILEAFTDALARNDIVTVTGGLGPTHDDITRSVVCQFFQTDLVVNSPALERITRIFTQRGIPLIKRNEEQALVPRTCTVIQNPVGTAPGYLFERDEKYFIVMPGVPFEMKAMMDQTVIPYLKQKQTNFIIRHRTLKTTGVGESILAERIGDIDALLAPHTGMTLAFLPSPFGVRLRISARGQDQKNLDDAVQDVERKIRAKAERYIYGTDQEELEQVIGTLLSERGLTLATAESCTGGLLADRITNVPGSSSYFERGFITYSNPSKESELHVPPALLQQYGAVSREVAEVMAENARTIAGTDIGLSTTGIAGPGGGTPEKSVGLVWIGYSDKQTTLAVRYNFGEDRRRVKERASQAALELLRRKILHDDV